MLLAGLDLCQAAGPISVELKAVAPYPDPHNVLVRPGDPVDLGYYVAEPATRFSGFQTDLLLDGLGEFLTANSGTWFSGNGVYDSVVANGTSGPPQFLYRILGHCLQNPPWLDGSGQLAVVRFRYDGPDPATVSTGGYVELVDSDGQVFSPVSGNTTVRISPGAGPAMVELKAVGPYPDPHEVRIGYGNTVTLGYYVILPVQDLSAFQTDVSRTGAGTFLGVERGSWFSGGGAYDSVVADGDAGPPEHLYRLVGYCLENPLSIDGVGDLALITFRYDGPDTVVLDAAAGFTELADEQAYLFSPVTGNVIVRISRHGCDRCDYNHDREIDYADVAPLSTAYGTTVGDPYYNPRVDYNQDSDIDFADVAILSNCYGASW